MSISRKKLKQAKRLYPAKSLKEIAALLSVDLDELTRGLKEEGIEFKKELPELFPKAKANKIYLLLLGLLVAVVYLNSLQNTFHYDDYHSLTENIHVRKLRNIYNFSSPTNFFTNAQTFSSKPGVKMVRPLLLTTFALNYAWSQYKAWSWELVNVLVHLFNVLLIYVFLTHISGNQKFAVIASLVFALHPVNTESVNYVNCRSSLLVSSCMLLSLYGFARSLLTRSRPWMVFSYVFFGIGFLFKEEAIVVIALAAVIDFLYLRKKGPQNIFERILFYYVPFLIVTLIYFYYRKWMMGILIQEHPPRPFMQNLFTESRVVVRYLNLLFWPLHLNTSYDVEVFTDLIKDKVGLALLDLGAWLALGLLLWKKFPVFTLFVLGFFITLSPTTLIPLNATMNEHRLYLPSLGLGLLLGQVVVVMDQKLIAWRKTALNFSLIALFVLWAVLLASRNRLWVSDMILWRDAISKSPAKAQVISDLGNAYYRKVPPNIDRAEQFYRWAIQADPTYFKAYHNLAIINFARGDRIAEEEPEKAREYYQNSVELFRQAVTIYPWNPDSWNDMGTAYLKLLDYEHAIENYNKAVQMDPLYFKGRYNLGYAYAMQKKYAEAEDYFIKALQIYDRDPKIWFALANAQYQDGKYQEALESLRKAKQILPESQELQQAYDKVYQSINNMKSGTNAPP